MKERGVRAGIGGGRIDATGAEAGMQKQQDRQSDQRISQQVQLHAGREHRGAGGQCA